MVLARFSSFLTLVSINEFFQDCSGHYSMRFHGWGKVSCCDFSEFSICLTTWLFGIIMIGIPSVLELLPVVVEKDKKTLLLVIVYRMTGPLGIFIDDFMLLINELPPQLRILIVGDFNSKFL